MSCKCHTMIFHLFVAPLFGTSHNKLVGQSKCVYMRFLLFRKDQEFSRQVLIFYANTSACLDFLPFWEDKDKSLCAALSSSSP